MQHRSCFLLLSVIASSALGVGSLIVGHNTFIRGKLRALSQQWQAARRPIKTVTHTRIVTNAPCARRLWEKTTTPEQPLEDLMQTTSDRIHSPPKHRIDYIQQEQPPEVLMPTTSNRVNRPSTHRIDRVQQDQQSTKIPENLSNAQSSYSGLQFSKDIRTSNNVHVAKHAASSKNYEQEIRVVHFQKPIENRSSIRLRII
ncbi:unnamed protein product [Cylicocyclus nassatus]|uniref:Secreted protein n=1 Tax=Cylicocyclus nassatus TaxID=53992 RepID=A0AA36MCI8_CYLNA|nr:unnamed protein product [Cylicocyclus nassatus]